MATVAEKNKEVSEVKELIAQYHRMFQRHERLTAEIAAYHSELIAFKSGLAVLCNAQESLENRKRIAEQDLARVEREAQTRLQNIEQGSRALTDKLSQKEIELDRKMAEAAKTTEQNAKLRHELELLKENYERKLSTLSEVKPKK